MSDSLNIPITGDASSLDKTLENIKSEFKEFGQTAQREVNLTGEQVKKLERRLKGLGTANLNKALTLDTPKLSSQYQRTKEILKGISVLPEDLQGKYDGITNQIYRTEKANRKLGNTLSHTNNQIKKNAVGFNGLSDAEVKAGRSAKQMRFAMQGLPAQFTDIFVSLQGGQRPLQVLFQQGGQIKDMFGGIKPAIRGVTKAIGAMINPITVTAAIAGGLFYAFYKGQSELHEATVQMYKTGEALGYTKEGMIDATLAASEFAGVTRGAAAQAITVFERANVKASAVTGEVIAMGIKAQKAGISTLDEYAKGISSLSDKPLKAALALNKQFNFLDKTTYKQLVTFTSMGNNAAAASLAQKAYIEEISNASKKAVEDLGFLERAASSVGTVFTNLWDDLKNLGRPSNALLELQSELKVTEGNLKLIKEMKPFAGQAESIANLKAKAKDLSEQITILNKTLNDKPDKRRTEAIEKAYKKSLDGIKRIRSAARISYDNSLTDLDSFLSRQTALNEKEQISDADFKEAKQSVLDQKLAITNTYNNALIAAMKNEISIRRGHEDDVVSQENALNELLSKMQNDRLKLSTDISIEKIPDKDNIMGALDGARSGFKTFAEEAKKSSDKAKAAIQDAMSGATDALTDFVVTGKADFKSLASSIISDLIRIAIQKNITGPLASSAVGLFANGGVFDGGIQKFANGGVVTKPTFFPMAKGAGLMGEAGPEAVMPLTRDAQGRLGVRNSSSGGDGMSSVEVNVINQTSNEVTARQSQPKYDNTLKRMVVNVILEDIHRGGQLKGALGGR
ncbi:phage tail tape measure protein [Photobacterium profundum]|nr:phage tail length tape measure family protein [Photobacterium profundum]